MSKQTFKGYPVLAIFRSSEGGVVLVDHGKRTYPRYVSWYLDRHDNSTSISYSASLDTALKIFRERVNRIKTSA
jgi:hypothetical protein